MLQTPYYLIDKSKLLRNMETIARLRDLSGAKALLALKCFATWGVFDMMADYMDGTTSSSLYELHLGREKFGKEAHAYSVAWADYEIDEALSYADKIIFNSIGQLQKFEKKSRNKIRGLRLNPGLSSSSFDLADPSRPFSRLGEWNAKEIENILSIINGFMIHNNCENDNFTLFDDMLSNIETKFGQLFKHVDWISLGGGIHFTGENYPLELFADRLKRFSDDYNVTVYLEPGEASITQSTTLEVSVLDTLHNGKDLAIVDSSIEAHMLDLLIYRENAKLLPNAGHYEIMVCGKSCLAGDIFGTFQFPEKLKIGDRLSFQDAGGYTMVKKNWFNGVNMPAIAIKEFDGTIHIQREFGYQDYKDALS
ncbi:carboxynorspermidine decarboxylase [Bartonella tamiae]|uniref:Carboxynorspermidine/carboxyspermidine decarboxylase n=1 Tax=Bartonella tamiae Th239 TaxID=1094558 RepID=J0QZK7_9HYPH|nr:carboxynorspermidine decarboxylase [Bartonella tamiae]EJF91591.1 carboxynorspermidine decarboxylase [Bartonella tamiae Th239]EJF92425.1 carboxynorspermidine decarboxylase [Bartonella tamiae Th307]